MFLYCLSRYDLNLFLKFYSSKYDWNTRYHFRLALFVCSSGVARWLLAFTSSSTVWGRAGQYREYSIENSPFPAVTVRNSDTKPNISFSGAYERVKEYSKLQKIPIDTARNHLCKMSNFMPLIKITCTLYMYFISQYAR